MRQRLRVGLVGLGFGVNYLRVYRRHPDVEYVGLCDLDERKLEEVGQRFEVSRRYRTLDDMIASREFDAIHLMTQIPDHAAQAIQVLEAGLHCACALPMGVSLDELARVVAAVQRNHRRYMLMEPNAYSPETLFVQGLFRRGEMGRIQFMRGLQSYFLNNHVHPYWRGLPPMHYVSHALAPLLVIADTRVTSVRCLGSGWMREELGQVHDNPFPIEAALMELALPGVVAEITIHFFETAVLPREGFDVFGEKLTFKWPEYPGEKPGLFRLVNPQGYFSNEVVSERIDIPSLPDSLPEPLAGLCQTEPLKFCGLVHEFVRSILEDREPALGVERSFDIIAPGIYAHLSALEAGRRLDVPSYPSFAGTPRSAGGSAASRP
jgi:predicted dehydrogenase